MSRPRQDTETELFLVEIVEDTNLRLQRHQEQSYLNKCNRLLYKMIYSKYTWNFFMGGLFIFMRLVSVEVGYTTITMNEWYNDSLFFILTNNYLYKRLHWNNLHKSYFNTQFKSLVVKIFMVCLCMFIIINSTIIDTFYITKTSVTSFKLDQALLFSFILVYVVLNQIYSVYFLYTSNHSERLVMKQLVKYLLLILFFLLDRILFMMNIRIHNTQIHYNDYHIHHWFFALIMLMLTEAQQPYYSIVQYIHYAIYLHGVALYGYDNVLK